MKNTFGNNMAVTLFGESHGNAIGAVVDGLAPGIKIDEDYIRHVLSLRRPAGDISTSRREPDNFVIQSGVFNGKTTGSPLCILIENVDKRSNDYSKMSDIARPSHADYAAYCKYHGFEDYRGGGHFSGRITAAICAVGGILLPALNEKGIQIGTHIKSIGSVSDRDFYDINEDIKALSNMEFAALDDEKANEMKQVIRTAKSNLDSVGGVLETAVTGLDAGIGEPFFDSVESMLSHALFSIPGVKGVEFGAGFAISAMNGSQANDEFYVDDGKVKTKTNNSGGINGGITNGMPLIFRCAMRPTPTIGKQQNTVDFKTLENTTLAAAGRHDPCIVHRARVVVDCITAITLSDMLTGRYGTDWLCLK